MASGSWPPGGPPMQMTESTGVYPGWRGPAYELRPLSLGEILDRSFAIYRAHFWLFVGISALSGGVQLAASAIQLLVYHGIRVRVQPTVSLPVLERQIGGSISGLLFFLAAAVTQAATVWALSQVYLGRQATIGASVRAVTGRWLRYVGIALWQAWSFVWLPLVVIIPGALLLMPKPWGVPWLGGTIIFVGATGGLVYGAIAFLRNALGVQAAVVEQLKVRPAMRRSKILAAGAKGRIFVVFLIAWCLYMVAGVLEAPLALFVGMDAMRGQEHVLAQIAMLLVNFIAHTAVSPVAMIGLSLVYFDQRVRQEALDLLLMLGGSPGDGTETIRPRSSDADAASELGPAGDAAAL